MSEKNLFTPLRFFLQIETEYGKGAWSGNIYRDVVAFPGDGEIITYKNNRPFQLVRFVFPFQTT